MMIKQELKLWMCHLASVSRCPPKPRNMQPAAAATTANPTLAHLPTTAASNATIGFRIVLR